MTYLYFQKHSGFTVIITIVFSSYRKKEKKIYVEYKCNLYVRFLLLTSYLPLHIVDIAVAMLAGHHYSRALKCCSPPHMKYFKVGSSIT